MLCILERLEDLDTEIEMGDVTVARYRITISNRSPQTFNELRLVYPTVAVRAKHRVIGRHIAVFFLGEFVELKRVFVVCLRLQFQESLGGVFNERFASLDAVV